MRGKSKSTEKKSSAEDIMGRLDDEQLQKVLKLRKHYREEAVRAAIREAIDRGIIQSEDDLLHPQFTAEPLKPKLFPEIENPLNRIKIRKSVGRSFVIAGILPVIRGFFRMNEGFVSEGCIVLAFGLIWMGVSVLVIRKFSYITVKILFALVGLSLVYVLRSLVSQPRIIFMDWFIISVIYLLVVYGMFFLLRQKNQLF